MKKKIYIYRYLYSPTNVEKRPYTGKRVLFRKYGVVLCKDDDDREKKEYENKEQ